MLNVLILCASLCMCLRKLLTRRVGQNRVYTPSLTEYLVIFLPKILYIHRIYVIMANLTQTW